MMWRGWWSCKRWPKCTWVENWNTPFDSCEIHGNSCFRHCGEFQYFSEIMVKYIVFQEFSRGFQDSECTSATKILLNFYFLLRISYINPANQLIWRISPLNSVGFRQQNGWWVAENLLANRTPEVSHSFGLATVRDFSQKWRLVNGSWMNPWKFKAVVKK